MVFTSRLIWPLDRPFGGNLSPVHMTLDPRVASEAEHDKLDSCAKLALLQGHGLLHDMTTY